MARAEKLELDRLLELATKQASQLKRAAEWLRDLRPLGHNQARCEYLGKCTCGNDSIREDLDNFLEEIK